MTSVEPIPLRVVRWRCPACIRSASRPARIREHMARCWYIPENRGCSTCVHFDRGSSPEPEVGSPGTGEECLEGVDLSGRPACGGCGGANFVPTGEIFRPRFAAPGRVVVQCPECKGEGGAVKPGPIIHCDLWQARDEETDDV